MQIMSTSCTEVHCWKEC